MNTINKETIYYHENLRFKIKDHLQHSLFWWPDTLIAYSVDFSGYTVKKDDLYLFDIIKNQEAPFQISRAKIDDNGNLIFADINFISDLPTGGERIFELRFGKRKLQEAFVEVTEARDCIILDNGVLKVKIPDSIRFPVVVPGPVKEINRGKGWFGSSYIVTDKRQVIEMTSVKLEEGPIFIEYQVTYLFEGDGKYTVNLKLIKGMPFIDISENMLGIQKEEGLYVKSVWSRFNPTHRHAPNNPKALKKSGSHYEDYNWQKIDEEWVKQHHPTGSWGLGEEGEIPFRLAPYEPWCAVVKLTYASFWDEETNDSLGIFINRPEEWDDKEYALFTSSDTLAVRYYYQEGLMWWKWPLAEGSRTTGLTAYDHTLDKEEMKKVEQIVEDSKAGRYSDGCYEITKNAVSYTSFLQNRYGTINLNTVKDWVLEYSGTPQLFEEGQTENTFNNLSDFQEHILCYQFFSSIPIYGTRENGGFSPVPSRRVHGKYIPAYKRFYNEMDDFQRQRITATLLFIAYITAGEQLMPMFTMLAGNPNYLSDIKSTLAHMAVIFPEHPKAKEWTSIYGKFVELSSRFYVRPALKYYNLKGGRWTENIGCYVWAYLAPLLHAEYVMQSYGDGRNRIANEYFSMLGMWLVDSLTAPFEGESALAAQEGKAFAERFNGRTWCAQLDKSERRRLHLPQGSHSYRRTPPYEMWLLGKHLERYSPMISEYFKWVARTDAEMSERKHKFVACRDNDKGTNPHLESCAYTGYGIVLRAGVDTDREVSIHLQQIDAGLNYRWGLASGGGCGNLFYYAGGKAYSHVGPEDVGDRQGQDTDFCCNFGVWKNGVFRGIGQNILCKPIFNMGLAQYVEIQPYKGKGAYSWPEYQSRSIVMMGTDYFLVHDAVHSEWVSHRFSWFTHIYDELPEIHILMGTHKKTAITTEQTKGVWFDGKGDCLAVITDRADIKAEQVEACTIVTSEAWTDYLFSHQEGLHYDNEAMEFMGTAGVIREHSTGEKTITIFSGSYLKYQEVEIQVDTPELAASISWSAKGDFGGKFFSLKGGRVSININDEQIKGACFYLNGINLGEYSELKTLHLSGGEYQWQLTKGNPVPMTPEISKIVSGDGKAMICFNAVEGAEYYILEESKDYGITWREIGRTEERCYSIDGLLNGEKYHYRVIAKNGERQSRPSREYPVYPSSEKPPFPEGLKIQLRGGKYVITWGEVLGNSGYRLYIREKGSTSYEMIYEGGDTTFVDERAEDGTLYEYCVASMNLNGEGEKGYFVDSDKNSLENWEPLPGKPYKRHSWYNNHPFGTNQQTPHIKVPVQYPETE